MPLNEIGARSVTEPPEMLDSSELLTEPTVSAQLFGAKSCPHTAPGAICPFKLTIAAEIGLI